MEVFPAVPYLEFDVIYNDDSVVLTVLSALSGDYNGNGVVDAADYTVWQDTLGSTTALVADGDNSGTVDAGDYDVWKTHFGETAGGGSTLGVTGSASVRAPVPEPAGLWPLATGLMALAVFSRTGWRTAAAPHRAPLATRRAD